MNELQHLTGIWIATIMCDALILFFFVWLTAGYLPVSKGEVVKGSFGKDSKREGH